MHVIEVVFKPNANLTIYEVYSLIIDNLPKHEGQPERRKQTLKKGAHVTFRITELLDTVSPILQTEPNEQSKTMVEYGCGPARCVYFKIAGQDFSELFTVAKVTNKIIGLSNTYILNIKNGLVKIGHGMCAGAFDLENGDNYEVAFQLLDQSGNKSAWAERISFTKPTILTPQE